MKRRSFTVPEKAAPRATSAPIAPPRGRLSLRYGGERPATDAKEVRE